MVFQSEWGKVFGGVSKLKAIPGKQKRKGKKLEKKENNKKGKTPRYGVDRPEKEEMRAFGVREGKIFEVGQSIHIAALCQKGR